MSAAGLAELLPHDGAMLLLHDVVDHRGDATCCATRLEPGGWLCDPDRGADGWLAVELMAQCVAAHEALCARADGAAATGGVLIGADGVALHAERLPTASPLRVHARRVRGRPGLGAVRHDCRIEDAEGRRLAEGTLTVAFGDAAPARGDS